MEMDVRTSMTEAGARLVPNMDLARRSFLRHMGLSAAAVAALGGGALSGQALAQESPGSVSPELHTSSFVQIFNFALNLEYLEAEYYLRAAFGRGLARKDTTGRGRRGRVIGGRPVPFVDDRIRQYAEEIAFDEANHVKVLRSVLGDAAVARPPIDLRRSFQEIARDANVPEIADPFSNENSFLLGAFFFEDVGVTAYLGAAPLLAAQDPALVGPAGAILAVEAYHAATIRSELFIRGFQNRTVRLSDYRDRLDNGPDGGGSTSPPTRTSRSFRGLARARAGRIRMATPISSPPTGTAWCSPGRLPKC